MLVRKLRNLQGFTDVVILELVANAAFLGGFMGWHVFPDLGRRGAAFGSNFHRVYPTG